jgi:hypothetical protein
MQLNLNHGQYKLDGDQTLWEWDFSPYSTDGLDEKLEAILVKHQVLYNVPNIWEKDDIIVSHCHLSLPIIGSVSLFVSMDSEKFKKKYVSEDGATVGIPGNQFFCSLISTLYLHDNCEVYKKDMDKISLELVEGIRDMFDRVNFNMNLYEDAVEVMESELKLCKKRLEGDSLI